MTTRASLKKISMRLGNGSVAIRQQATIWNIDDIYDAVWYHQDTLG